MKIHCEQFVLKLREPFTIARGTVTEQPTMIVRVEHDGLVGYGEATTNPFYGATLENMQSALARAESCLESYQLENPMELWSELDPLLSDSRFAQAALDCAIWDLYAQMHSQPLWQLWGFRLDDPMPPTCFTIGLDSPEVMAEKLAARPDFPVYKIKLDATGGVPLIGHLRSACDKRFRVDANCSWQEDDVLERAQNLADLNVELIEQPLPADAYDAMARLKGKSPIPLMADESCQVDADVERCADCFDAINIKLVKCGGLSPARRMIARARQKGLKVMVGCMTESSIGIAAGAHLLPLLDYADLDGALLLESDISTGLNWQNGYCELTATPGIGVSLRSRAAP